MSGPMVRAILEGRKTQTRRVCKRAYNSVSKEAPFAICPARKSGWIAWYGEQRLDIAEFTLSSYEHGFPYPYGQSGDRLWVREPWRAHLCAGREEEIHYRADGESCPVDGKIIKPWRPSIFMPRCASRITLEITNVRIERVQEISEEDSIAEGIHVSPGHLWRPLGSKDTMKPYTHWQAFAAIWDSINVKKMPWSDNPWVWVITFQRVP